MSYEFKMLIFYDIVTMLKLIKLVSTDHHFIASKRKRFWATNLPSYHFDAGFAYQIRRGRPQWPSSLSQL